MFKFRIVLRILLYLYKEYFDVIRNIVYVVYLLIIIKKFVGEWWLFFLLYKIMIVLFDKM